MIGLIFGDTDFPKEILKKIKRKKLKYIIIDLSKKSSFKKDKKSLKVRDANVQSLENSLTEKIGLKVIITNKKNNKGSIKVEYKDLDQLNRLIDVIKSNY